jgi:glycosyltransferase involved in cell wall biosynthesis
MKISVLIPAYNCEGTIRHTMDSVLAQTRPPDEVLVIDDGSTDQTSAILKSYKPRVQVLKQEKQGVSVARNVCLNSRRGDLLVFGESYRPDSLLKSAGLLATTFLPKGSIASPKAVG